MNQKIIRYVDLLKSFSVYVDLVNLGDAFRPDHYTRNTPFLRRGGLMYLSRLMLDSINNFLQKKSCSNLKFVPLVNGTDKINFNNNKTSGQSASLITDCVDLSVNNGFKRGTEHFLGLNLPKSVMLK